MKIKFIIGVDPEVTCASEWNEILKYAKEYPTIDEKGYALFKALERNKELEREIKISRKALNIPENGLTWKQYIKGNPRNKTTKKELDWWLYFIKNYHTEIKRINRKLILHPIIYEQLKTLILGDYVEPFYRGLGYGTNVDELGDDGEIFQDGDVESVIIYISKKVSKNELLKFISQQWKELTKLMNKLPDDINLYISKRDLRIVELRDNFGMKYSKIAEKIVQEFQIDNFEGTINEDSVKTSYKRAKEKIQILAKPKKKHKQSRTSVS